MDEQAHHFCAHLKEPTKVKVKSAEKGSPNIYVKERSDGWKVVEVGV